MEEKRNAYEILETSRDAVITIGGISKEAKEANQNDFLVHKRDDTLLKLERYKTPLIEQLREIEENKNLGEMQDLKLELDLRKKIKEIEDEIRLVRSAYLEIKDQKSRQAYDDYMDFSIKMQDSKSKIDRNLTENAYQILHMKNRCDDTKRDSRKIDNDLLNIKNFAVKEKKKEIKKLQAELASLEGKRNAESYRKKSRIDGDIVRLEREIERVESAYAKVATKELRKAYNVELKQQEDQVKERIRQSELRRKYKILKSNNPKIMRLANSTSVRLIKYTSFDISEKEKIKQEKDKKRKLSVTLVREDGTPVTVERIGELTYQNAFNQVAKIDAYRITRTVDGEKKWDVRYTNLNMVDLSRNPKTGELQNEEYHDFVANVFLSEDSIEGTGYNDGYLGQALMDKDGNYFQEFRNIEELVAVMKFNERMKENTKKGKTPESIEGDLYEK